MSSSRNLRIQIQVRRNLANAGEEPSFISFESREEQKTFGRYKHIESTCAQDSPDKLIGCCTVEHSSNVMEAYPTYYVSSGIDLCLTSSTLQPRRIF